MKNKYFYPIFKLKAKSWIRYWLLKKTEFKGKLSEILTGFSFNLENTLNRKFKIFEIQGHSIQDGEPSPENEVPILSSGDNGSITEKIVNGNLLEITENNRRARCTYVSGANTNQYKLLCTAADMYVNEIQSTGTSYNKARNGNLIPCTYGETIYFDTGNSLFANNYFTEFDENLISLGYYTKQISSGTYTPTNSNCKYVTFRFGYGANAQAGTTYTLAPIVSKTPINSYVPHEEQTYSIYTQQPMRSIGDVRDVFFKNTVDSPYYDENLILNGWYERHYIGRKVFDGTEDWGVNNHIFYMPIADKIKQRMEVLSNVFRYYNGSWVDTSNYQLATEDNNYIFIRDNDYSTKAEFNTWLSEQYANGHPLYIDYLSQEPTNLLCTTEQTNILENIPSTFAGQTNVYSTDEVEPFLKIQYWESDTNG